MVRQCDPGAAFAVPVIRKPLVRFARRRRIIQLVDPAPRPSQFTEVASIFAPQHQHHAGADISRSNRAPCLALVVPGPRPSLLQKPSHAAGGHRASLVTKEGRTDQVFGTPQLGLRTPIAPEHRHVRVFVLASDERTHIGEAAEDIRLRRKESVHVDRPRTRFRRRSKRLLDQHPGRFPCAQTRQDIRCRQRVIGLARGDQRVDEPASEPQRFGSIGTDEPVAAPLRLLRPFPEPSAGVSVQSSVPIQAPEALNQRWPGSDFRPQPPRRYVNAGLDHLRGHANEPRNPDGPVLHGVFAGCLESKELALVLLAVPGTEARGQKNDVGGAGESVSDGRIYSLRDRDGVADDEAQARVLVLADDGFGQRRCECRQLVAGQLLSCTCLSLRIRLRRLPSFARTTSPKNLVSLVALSQAHGRRCGQVRVPAIERLEKRQTNRRAHPPRRAGFQDLESIIPHPVQLRRRPEPRSHQLHFVHDPQAVVVQKPEVHRPAIPAHPVATVEGSGKKHVLRAYEHGVPLHLGIPFADAFAPHDHVKPDLIREFEIRDPLVRIPKGLLDECALGQAVDEPARPVAATLRDAVPEPGQHDRGGLPEAGGDVDEHRLACAAGTQPPIVAACRAFAACEPCLVLVVLVQTKPCCLRKQVIEPPGQDRIPLTPRARWRSPTAARRPVFRIPLTPRARWRSPTAARRPVFWRPLPASRCRRR